MSDRELDKKINNAFKEITPDVLTSILADCEEKGQELVMKESVINKRPVTLRRFASLAAVFLILLGSVIGVNAYQMNKAVSARVSLDVNPSVEIQVNKNERVLDVVALNEDGKVIVGDMDFSGSDIDVAVNALVGSMMRNGYLSDMANSILVTVSGRDTTRDAALQARITEEIERILAGYSVDGAILSQVLVEDKSLEAIAKEYGITPGKARLIEEIIASNPLYTIADLVPLTINELNLLMLSHEIEFVDIKAQGEASDTAYIGNDAAEKAALEHAGVAADKAASVTSRLEWEHGKMVYDVEFKSEGFEYEYDVDATTGVVIDFEKDVDDDYRHSGSAGSTTTATAPQQSGGNTQPSGGNAQPQNSGGSGAPAQSGNSSSAQTTISSAAAQEIALNHAGLNASNVTELEVEFDREDNEYDVSFKAGGLEYDYDINAITGAIIRVEKETDDDYRPSGSSGSTTTASAQQPPAQSSAPAQSGSAPTQTQSSAPAQGSSAPASSGSTQQSGGQSSQSTKTLIGEGTAQTKALSHAGLSASQVRELEVEYDRDDATYDVSFKSGGYEYDYEINAYTGAIIKSEKERDD